MKFRVGLNPIHWVLLRRDIGHSMLLAALKIPYRGLQNSIELIAGFFIVLY